jgi:hypothetical protein
MIPAIYARHVLASLLCCALLLAGCVTHGRLDAALPQADPRTAAEITVIREWRFIGGGANLIVLLDGVPLYGISVDEHVVLSVPPGDRILSVTHRGPGANEAAVTVKAEPKQRYYFYVETGSVYYPGPLLLPIDPARAHALMAKTTRISP